MDAAICGSDRRLAFAAEMSMLVLAAVCGIRLLCVTQPLASLYQTTLSLRTVDLPLRLKGHGDHRPRSTRPGPKCRGGHNHMMPRCSHGFVLLFALLFAQHVPQAAASVPTQQFGIHFEPVGVRVDAPAGGHSHGRVQNPAPTWSFTKKRAYRRARRRAERSLLGGTYLKGRWMTAESLGAIKKQQAIPLPTLPGPRGPPGRPPHKARLRILTVNVGGLCTATYDIFRQWLQEQDQADIVALQETHHGLGRASWSDTGWHVVSSADPQHRFAGVAIFVSARIATEAQIRFRAVIPGRLIEVCLHRGQGRQESQLHLVNAYQWAWSFDSQQKQFWEKLHVLLQAIPVRHGLCLMGDMNTPASATGKHVGTGVPVPIYTPPDVDSFVGVVCQNDLCLLNTWQKARGGRAQTFVRDGGGTQIDFVAVRLPQADPVARCPRICLDLDFSPWRQGGKHRAIFASVPLNAALVQAKGRTPFQKPYAARMLDAAVRKNDLRMLEPLRATVAGLLVQQQPQTVAALNQVLLQACLQVFPTAPRANHL